MSLSAYMTPAGRRTRLAPRKSALGREKRSRPNHFMGRAPRTHERALAAVWFGLSLSAVGYLTQVLALLWWLGGTG